MQSKTQAVIIAIGLVVGIAIGGLLFGGIYESQPAVKGLAVYRVNKFTGAVSACFLKHACEEIPEATVPTMAPSAFSSAEQSAKDAPAPKNNLPYNAKPVQADPIPTDDFLYGAQPIK